MTMKWENGRSQMSSIAQLVDLCDISIIYDDNSPMDELPHIQNVTEILKNTSSATIWTDYYNRMTLLCRAAAYGADYVLWLDDDELLLNQTRDGIETIIKDMIRQECELCNFKKYEMWDMEKCRVDGIWGNKGKTVIQKNPMLKSIVAWKFPVDSRLHAVPLQIGKYMLSDSIILHYGTCSQTLRQERVQKYRNIDPTNKYQSIGYDYMLDETEIVLKNVSEL